MKGKRAAFAIAIITMAAMLTGCGEKFPDMTEEEYNQTVEFAVGLLMKYSNNGQEKLVYVDAKEEQKQRDKEAREAAKKETESQSSTTPSQPVVPVYSTEESTEDAETDIASDDASDETSKPDEMLADASIEDSSAGEGTGSEQNEEETSASTQTNNGSTSGSAITLSSDQSQEIADDIFLSYQGYSISSTYPESSKSYVVNADKGKKLLVLRFDLYNASSSTKKINMINQKLLFQILLNGKNLGYSSVTFLPNDLSSFIGDVESKAHESLVVLTQISESEAKEVKTLGMIVSMNGMEQEVTLD